MEVSARIFNSQVIQKEKINSIKLVLSCTKPASSIILPMKGSDHTEY